MSDTDGKVVILIETNADKAASVMGNLDQAVNKFKNTSNTAAGSVNGFDNASKGLSNSLSSLKGAAGIAVTGIAALKLKDIAVDAVNTAGAFEQLKISFEVFTGSAQAGDELTNSLIELAKVTPMTTQGLSKNAQTLLGFGEATENIIGDLKMLGDISGGNTERMNALTLAFSQMGATGRLMGQDLLQMVNAGFNPLQTIADKTGKSMSVLKEEMGEGKITFSMVKDAMKDATSEGGRFYGMMQKQSESLNGKLSTLADTWELVSKNIGDLFLPLAKEAVNALITLGNTVLALQQKMDNFHQSASFTNVDTKRQAAYAFAKEYNQYMKLAENADKRGAKSRAESYRNIALKRLEEAKRLDREARELTNDLINSQKVPTSSAGFKDSGPSDKDKNKRDSLQSKMSEIKAKMEKLTLAGKQNTVEFQNLTAQYEKYKSAVDAVNAVLDGKGAYEKLSENLSQTIKRMQDLAAVGKTDTDAFKTLQKNAKDYSKQLQNVDDATKIFLTPYEELEYKAQSLQEQMAVMASQPIVDMKAFNDLKLKATEAQIALEKVKTAIHIDISPYDALNTKISNIKQQMYDLAVQGEASSKAFKDLKNEMNKNANLKKRVDAEVASAVGLDWSQIADTISTDLTSALTTPLQEGENAFERFGNVALNIVQMIVSELVRIAVVAPIVKALTGGLFADGGVFKNGNVIPHAKGGVVTSPAFFPMSGGRTGLMGEAGAEAIMPLRRTASGKLGVEATTGNQVVNIFNQSNSEIETVQNSDGEIDVFIKKVDKALSNERTNRGFTRALQRQQAQGVQAS